MNTEPAHTHLQLRSSTASSKSEREEKRSTKLWQEPKNPTSMNGAHLFQQCSPENGPRNCQYGHRIHPFQKKSSGTAKAQKTEPTNARDHCNDQQVIVRGLPRPLLAVIRSQYKVEILLVLVGSSFVLSPCYPTLRKVAEKFALSLRPPSRYSVTYRRFASIGH
jgi:hypothetical protein